MYKRWPILAQILIALGCGGGLISLWVGFTQRNLLIVVLGLIVSYVFWSFYQLRPWAQKAVTALLCGLLLSDVITIAMGLVELIPGCVVVLFRGLIVYYFNTNVIKALFDINTETLENA